MINYLYAGLCGCLAAFLINIDMEIGEEGFAPEKLVKCLYKRLHYLGTELLFISAFVGIYYFYGFTYRAVVYAVFLVLLVFISVQDIKEQLVSNSMLITFFIMGLLILPINKDCTALNYLGSLLFYTLAFLGISKATRSAIGVGDAYILGLTGLFLGFAHTFAVLLYAVVISGLITLILFMLKIVSRKSTLPFAPFIAFGFIISILI